MARVSQYDENLMGGARLLQEDEDENEGSVKFDEQKAEETSKQVEDPEAVKNSEVEKVKNEKAAEKSDKVEKATEKSDEVAKDDDEQAPTRPDDPDSKYKFTGKSKVIDGETVWQIEATESFKAPDGSEVKAGDKGGWIASKDNLSASDNAWVGKDASVRGNAKVMDEAMVLGHADVSGEAIVKDHAQVGVDDKTRISSSELLTRVATMGLVGVRNDTSASHAKVSGNAIIEGNARVRGDAEVTDFARVSDEAVVEDHAQVRDSARVRDDAKISDNAEISGNATVHDNAVVSGNSKVKDDAEVSGHARVRDDAEVSDQAKVNDFGKVSGHGVVDEHAEIGGASYVTGSAKVTDEVKMDNGRAWVKSGELTGKDNISTNIGVALNQNREKLQDVAKTIQGGINKVLTPATGVVAGIGVSMATMSPVAGAAAGLGAASVTKKLLDKNADKQAVEQSKTLEKTSGVASGAVKGAAAGIAGIAAGAGVTVGNAAKKGVSKALDAPKPLEKKTLESKTSEGKADVHHAITKSLEAGKVAPVKVETHNLTREDKANLAAAKLGVGGIATSKDKQTGMSII